MRHVCKYILAYVYQNASKNFITVVIVRDEIEIAAESFEEENGNFNEFGAPDPLGVPIAEVLAEPVVIVPDIIPPAEVENWKDVPILESTDELFG